MFGRTKARESKEQAQAAAAEVLSIKASAELLDQFTRPDEELFPPYRRGFPAIHPEALLRSNDDIIKKIRENLRLSQAQYDKLIHPLFLNLAAFYQLLPASESHHHNRAGGLLRHSLEVAFLCGQAAEGATFARAGSNLERTQSKPRWQVATLMVGLLHDCGKPETDYFIYSSDVSKRWNPYKESLYEWATSNSVDRYFITWSAKRHQRHLSTVAAMSSILVPQELLSYLDTSDGLVRREYHAALSGVPTKMKSIADKFDAISALEDRKKLGNSMLKLAWDVPLQARIFQAMIFVAEQPNMANNLRAPFWHLKADPGRLYINWKIAYPAIINELRRMGEPLEPTSDALSRLMIETGTFEPLIKVIDGEQVESPYWHIRPVLGSSNDEAVVIDDLMIRCVRIPEVSMIFRGDAPAAIEGMINELEPPQAAAPSNEEGVESVKSDDNSDASEVSSGPSASSGSNVPPIQESENPAPTRETTTTVDINPRSPVSNPTGTRLHSAPPSTEPTGENVDSTKAPVQHGTQPAPGPTKDSAKHQAASKRAAEPSKHQTRKRSDQSEGGATQPSPANIEGAPRLDMSGGARVQTAKPALNKTVETAPVSTAKALFTRETTPEELFEPEITREPEAAAYLVKLIERESELRAKGKPTLLECSRDGYIVLKFPSGATQLGKAWDVGKGLYSAGLLGQKPTASTSFTSKPPGGDSKTQYLVLDLELSERIGAYFEAKKATIKENPTRFGGLLR